MQLIFFFFSMQRSRSSSKNNNPTPRHFFSFRKCISWQTQIPIEPANTWETDINNHTANRETTTACRLRWLIHALSPKSSPDGFCDKSKLRCCSRCTVGGLSTSRPSCSLVSLVLSIDCSLKFSLLGFPSGHLELNSFPKELRLLPRDRSLLSAFFSFLLPPPCDRIRPFTEVIPFFSSGPLFQTSSPSPLHTQSMHSSYRLLINL